MKFDYVAEKLMELVLALDKETIKQEDSKDNSYCL